MSELKLHPIKKVTKSTLKNQVCTQIKELILSHSLLPGQPIVIDKLAEEFGISHIPVREALVMLETDGLVELNSYQNPKVADVNADDVRDVYEMRLMVEDWAVEQAAQFLTDEEMRPIDDLLLIARVQAAVNDYGPHVKSDLLLHETILRSTKNKLFWLLAQRIHDRSILVRSMVEAKGSSRDITQIIDEHCQIMEALHAHDSDRARKAMLAHLNAGYKRTLLVLD